MIVCVLWVCMWVHTSEEARGISVPLNLKPKLHAIVSHETQALKTELAFARAVVFWTISPAFNQGFPLAPSPPRLTQR